MKDIFDKDQSGEDRYGAIAGSHSVVTHDVPPMTIVAGNPTRIIKKIEE